MSMAHNIEIKDGQASMFYAGETPWHRLGTTVEREVTAGAAIRLAGLDWAVEKRPMYIAGAAQVDGIPVVGPEVPEKFAVIPPKKPFEERGGSYGWNPQTTQREGLPIPRIYGRCPVKGNVIMSYGQVSNTAGSYDTTAWTYYGAGNPLGPHFTMPITAEHPTTVASDYVWNLKLAYGDGPVKGIVAGTEKINGRSISAYTGLSVTHRSGTDVQEAVPMGDRTQ